MSGRFLVLGQAPINKTVGVVNRPIVTGGPGNGDGSGGWGGLGVGAGSGNGGPETAMDRAVTVGRAWESVRAMG